MMEYGPGCRRRTQKIELKEDGDISSLKIVSKGWLAGDRRRCVYEEGSEDGVVNDRLVAKLWHATCEA